MDSIADDLIEGIKQISRFTGIPERRAFYLAEKGELPGVFKQGGPVGGPEERNPRGLC
ncbi:hypothetical protein AB4853_10380 [Bradyrhizobium sp. 1050_B9_N1_2]|uniref:hypothetical protein n=1 Tax=Bradyrhizobium sp. 1050_B9_N1_2 TaxID=3238688 RepID=UPI003EDB8A87